MAFKQENAEQQGDDVDIIGQFGVGFYSRVHGGQVTCAWCRQGLRQRPGLEAWESDGVEGYTIERGPARRATAPTSSCTLKDNTDEDESFDQLPQRVRPEEPHQALQQLRALPHAHGRSSKTPREAQARGRRRRLQARSTSSTPRSRPSTPWCPSGQRSKSDVTDEEYNEFYKQTFHDFADPAAHASRMHAEGAALLRRAAVHARAARRTTCTARTTRSGLALYSSNVLIMEKCEDLLPDYFNFVRGVVDSQDLTLNISRETLQHNSQLHGHRPQSREEGHQPSWRRCSKNDRDAYEKFFEQLRPRPQVRHLHQLRHAQGRAGRPAAVLLAPRSRRWSRWPSTSRPCPPTRSPSTTPPATRVDRLAKLPIVNTVLGQGLRRAAVHEGRRRVLLPGHDDLRS